MKTNGSKTLPTIASLLSGALWALFIYLIFVLPKQVAGWEDAGEALPAVTLFMIRIGTFCQRFCILVVPILVLLTVGCISWFFVASRSKKSS